MNGAWVVGAIEMERVRKRAEAEDWGQVRRISRWGNTRRVRRLVVMLWITALAVDPWMVMRLSQGIEVLAKVPQLLLATLTQLLITWATFRGMQIGLAQPPLTDSAVLQYGTEFETLTEADREELLRARSRELLLGKVERDERETELQTRAERTSYRLLRPGLAVVVAAYWALCLLGPFAAVRSTLLVTAIGVTWLAVAVLALPTMVRMWTQADEAGETQIVTRTTQK